MKDVVGSPGTWSSLVLRVYSAYGFLFFTMLFQLLWSFSLACIDIHALRTKLDLRHNDSIVFLFLYGDTVFALLVWASASASAGLTILLDRDVHFCEAFPHLSCGQYKLFVILAFMAWSFTAASAYSMFWLLVSFLG